MSRSVASRMTAVLLLLWLAALATPIAAKPIALSQPFDLSGKRVLVVSMLGNRAVVYLPALIGLKPEIGSMPDADMDSLVAEEARRKLESFGAQAQIVEVAYDFAELYDEGKIARGKITWFKWRAARARAHALLDQHSADALLFIGLGAKFSSEYTPPFIGYGVARQREDVARITMSQSLFLPGRAEPFVHATATGARPIARVARQIDPAYPTDAEWVAARPALDDAAGRVTRSLVAEIYDRASSPRGLSKAPWRLRYPYEDGVFR
ncbi:hypothetical protein [Tahibacter sp.]|uniref:hypothetical protein n=1 Tax=Tahibacter sp. TaxID=2056211 RepID=UPI0028C4274F|nr:hypothetical protein [Tahibacter sp.]